MDGTVIALWRYPVKSMAGEPLARATLDRRIEGDREWGVFDAATGKLLSAKTVGALLLARARWTDGEAVIELPGGAVVIAGTPDAERAIGAWLGRAVSLRRASDEPATIDMELDDGDGDGPRGMKSFATRPGSLFDSRSALHLVGEATLAALDRDHALGGGDVRRYRPNLVVSGIAVGAEDAWIDREVRIGEVTAHARKRTERCVMIGRPQHEIAGDRALLRHLKARYAMRLGIYLDPRGPGTLAVGDRVEAALPLATP